MSKLFESLDDQDVQLIDRLVETLNRSSFDFFRLESGATTLVIGKGLPPADGAQQPAAAQTPAVVAPAAAVAAAPAPVVEPDAATPSSGQDTVAAQPVVVEEGTIPVVSPTVGRFYSRPEPTAEP